VERIIPMSFIRSFSNPEELYIYESSSDKCIHVDGELYFCVPRRIFYRLCRKFDEIRDASRRLTVGKLWLEERWFHSKSRKILSKSKEPSWSKIGEYDERYVLCWKGKMLPMWKVTWAYIWNNAMSELDDHIRRGELSSLSRKR